MAVKASARKAAKYYHIDIEKSSQASHLVRADFVRKLSLWENDGIIELKVGGLQHVYHVLNKPPSTAAELSEVCNKLYYVMQVKEKRDLERTEDLVNLVTGEQCFHRAMAAYFGDASDGLPAECGHCTWCETHEPVNLPTIAPEKPDETLVQAVLKACSVRDDPRFLARVAFGITSPRVMALKLQKSHVYRSMNDCDFLVGSRGCLASELRYFC